MELKAVAFDMDDTLLRDDLSISGYTLSVLHRAAQSGIHVIPASGRAHDSIAPFADQIGTITCYIACNGAEVWSPDHQLLMRKQIDPALAQEIVAFGEKYDAYAQTYEGPCFYFNAPEDSEWARAYARSSMLRGVHIGPLSPFLRDHATSKILMMGQPEDIAVMLADARSTFGDRVSVTCSKPYFLEFNPADATKGKALTWCAEHFGFRMEDTAAFGDSLNDLSMLQAAGLGVVMENGREDVKAMIPTHCGSNMQDGVAHMIEDQFLRYQA